MKIFLIRHGESTSDVEDRYGGDFDDHLTEKGKIQASALAEKLLDKNIEAIFTSPKLRAKETAGILSQNLGITAQVTDDLRERNAYGILTGMTKEEAEAKYPELAEAVKHYSRTIEGAEDYNDFKHRIIKVIDHIITFHDLENIAIVTHGGPIRCYFREKLEKGELSHLGDCALFEFDHDKHGLRLLNIDNASF